MNGARAHRIRRNTDTEPPRQPIPSDDLTPTIRKPVGGWKGLLLAVRDACSSDRPISCVLLSVFLGFAITIFTWARLLTPPAAGLDGSWETSESLALGHVHFGSGLLFTYGPLGTLSTGVFVSGRTALLSLVYLFGLSLLLAAMLLWMLRQWIGLGLAVIFTWVIMSIVGSFVDGGDLVAGPGLLLALLAVRLRSRRGLLVLVFLGTLSGVALLVKFSTGLELVAIGVLAAVTYPQRLRRTGAVVGAFASTSLLAWVLSGQRLSDLHLFLVGSVSVATGYTEAMSTHELVRGPENWYAALGLLALSILTAAHHWSLRGIPLFASLAVVVVWTWGEYKEGFVRHDGHDLIFFGLIIVIAAALDGARLPRNAHLGILLITLLVALSAASGWSQYLLSPVGSTHRLAHDVAIVTSGQERRNILLEDRAQLIASGENLSSSVLAAIGNHTVAVTPNETTLQWVYRSLRWDPVPVLQGYSAYTTYLDDRDSTYLSSASAPQRLLTEPVAIDGRYPFFDPPNTILSEFCHYALGLSTSTWQVLNHVADRCGRAHILRTVTTRFNDTVTVPTPPDGTILTAKIRLSDPLTNTIAGLLLKPDATYVTLSDGANSTVYRYITGTTGDSHVLRTPNALRFGPTLTPLQVRTIQFIGNGISSHGGRVQITFEAIPIT